MRILILYKATTVFPVQRVDCRPYRCFRLLPFTDRPRTSKAELEKSPGIKPTHSPGYIPFCEQQTFITNRVINGVNLHTLGLVLLRSRKALTPSPGTGMCNGALLIRADCTCPKGVQ